VHIMLVLRAVVLSGTKNNGDRTGRACHLAQTAVGRVRSP
jgi:hypothetical protein